MEYKQIIDGLNNLDTKTRKTYDQLHVMSKVFREETINKPTRDSELEKTLYSMSTELRPKIEVTKKGILMWEKEAYALTNYGKAFFDSEKDSINKINKEISKIKTYSNIDQKVDEILKSYNTNPVEYFAKKTILIDKELNNDTANVFSRIQKIGDYLSNKTSFKESKKKREVEKYSSNNFSSTNSSNDDMFTYMMLGGIIMDDSHSSSNNSISHNSSEGGFFSSLGSSGCGGGSTSSCSGGSTSSCGGGSSGCGGGGCGGGGCGGS